MEGGRGLASGHGRESLSPGCWERAWATPQLAIRAKTSWEHSLVERAFTNSAKIRPESPGASLSLLRRLCDKAKVVCG